MCDLSISFIYATGSRQGMFHLDGYKLLLFIIFNATGWSWSNTDHILHFCLMHAWILNLKLFNSSVYLNTSLFCSLDHLIINTNLKENERHEGGVAQFTAND
ncbi:hypothetical protein AQUCO_00901010v1 [Aquilegia coerulea]|uniref:Uncharacterized protein n=1 Tax=Aquilegia coerulea TaxID=218851 RepID=A0A2G5EGE0_AQUCA|nr:hypothetical protein AQUCO_00901010v1 [Aquilegia coerulea]